MHQCKRRSIAHGKKIDIFYSAKGQDNRISAKEVFDGYGGFKVLTTPDEIKADLVVQGPVVSSSFHLCGAFLSSVEDRKRFFKKCNAAGCGKRRCRGKYCWTHYPHKKTCQFIDKETNAQCQQIEAYQCKGYCKEHGPERKKKLCKFIDKENDEECTNHPQTGCNRYCWTHYDKQTCKFIDKETNVQCQQIEAYLCKGYCKEHGPERKKKLCKFIDKENDEQCTNHPCSGCNGYCWTHYDKQTCKFIDTETNAQCQQIEAYHCKGYCKEHGPKKNHKRNIVEK
ncbi:predicted protein [Chaetoceros tenuissimus]|uniref:Uncharacterized protein n=1 Tax=Chaetoceros tenuissimus TaxID=426638 RepID=A0AAD3CV40_9STRA|nr:predicted protein [Chaetoceros tenuissimus]